MADHDYGKRVAMRSTSGVSYVRDASYFDESGRKGISALSFRKKVRQPQGLKWSDKETFELFRLIVANCGYPSFSVATNHPYHWRGDNKRFCKLRARWEALENPCLPEVPRGFKAIQVKDESAVKAIDRESMPAPEQPRDNPERSEHWHLVHEHRRREGRIGMTTWVKRVKKVEVGA